MDERRTTTLNDNIDLISALYPKASINDEQWDTFRQFCGLLNQDTLADAIRWVAHYKSAREPSWRAFSERYAAIKQEQTYTPEPRYTGTMTWHVAWQRTSKHGVPGAWYGCRVQSRQEAEEIAKANGGRVTCMSKADDDEDYSDEAMRADEIRARETLAGLSRNQISAMVDRLRSIGFVTEKLSARLSDWPRMAALTVYAEYRNQQERRK